MGDTNWDDVIGQSQLINNLKSALEHKKVSHAYLFQGERLSGKKMTADIFARALECEADGERPCNRCRACRQAINGNHPDIIRVTHEKANTISVDNVRQQINGDIAIKPYSGAYKIYIMDEAEKMNVQAQNALLKTLEEPPEYAVILLLATRAEAMLPTILSRCVVLNVKSVPEDRIKRYLTDRVQVQDYRAGICASFARGNVGRAVELASNESFDHMKSAVLDMMKKIAELETNQVAVEVKRITEEKFDTDDYLDLCFTWFRDVLLYKACGDKRYIIFKEETTEIGRAAERYGYEKIERIIRSIERARSRLEANVNFDLTMELMFSDMIA
ncbi:MAG: DNA polymerase III subunit delta' [Roseburia sp.]|nr:DNA polymerase III subunit delta' [Roseburia sp.]